MGPITSRPAQCRTKNGRHSEKTKRPIPRSEAGDERATSAQTSTTGPAGRPERRRSRRRAGSRRRRDRCQRAVSSGPYERTANRRALGPNGRRRALRGPALSWCGAPTTGICRQRPTGRGLSSRPPLWRHRPIHGSFLATPQRRSEDDLLRSKGTRSASFVLVASKGGGTRCIPRVAGRPPEREGQGRKAVQCGPKHESLRRAVSEEKTQTTTYGRTPLIATLAHAQRGSGGSPIPFCRWTHTQNEVNRLSF